MSAFYKTDPLTGNPILFIHYISNFQIVFCNDMGLWKGTLGFTTILFLTSIKAIPFQLVV